MVRANPGLAVIPPSAIAVPWFHGSDDIGAEVIGRLSTRMDAASDRAREAADSIESRSLLQRFDLHNRSWHSSLPLFGRFVFRPLISPNVRLNLTLSMWRGPPDRAEVET